MTRAPRILMVSSEVASLARTGGLGDAVEALALELAGLGAEVLLVTPKYRSSRAPPDARWWRGPLAVPVGSGRASEMRVLEGQLGSSRRRPLRVCLLVDDALFDRDGIYGDARGPYGDNALRFARLSNGALSLAETAWPGRLPDVLHAHDWHAAPAIFEARFGRGPRWARVPSVLTIHNLAYQGSVEASEVDALGLPPETRDADWARRDGRLNLLKGAVELADRVTTVSVAYAKEIQEPAHGHGLDAHLRMHASKLVGIVNGIDATSFDPRVDAAIARAYGDAEAPVGKARCKAALLAELGLHSRVEGGARAPPLFGFVSRLDWLKGTDLLTSIVPALVARGARVVLEGTGDPALERTLRDLGGRWPGRVASSVAFDPALARRIFAGADFLVVPSRDEPCGLTQMYAMRYGAIPVVTPVGGLLDTVVPVDAAHATGTGFVAAAPDAISLLLACEEALGLWGDRMAMDGLVARAMARDSSWSAGARQYLSLFESLL